MKLKMQTSNDKTLINTENTQEGVILEPQYLGFLRSQGYVLQSVEKRHTVPSSDGEHAHLVYKTGSYQYPKGSSLLDVADPEQQIKTWVCSCADFRFNKSADVRDATVSPDDSGVCRHIKQVSKVVKAREDESQATLGDSDA